MGFPTLFADTDGDPANHSAIMSISENDLETFAAELKHLINFAEKKKWRKSIDFLHLQDLVSGHIIYFTRNNYFLKKIST